MQYTEEHYAQMYNNLPEGLKDLVLSGRLAIMVSAIGARHALTAEQTSNLEPAVEDVCLGLITKEELADNIKSSINVENRVAMRIAADAETDILKDYIEELKNARLFKMELDHQIQKDNGGMPQTTSKNFASVTPNITSSNTPEDMSPHLIVKDTEVKDWYKKADSQFDWEKNLTKPKIHTPLPAEFKEEVKPVEVPKHTIANVEGQLATLTETINKLVQSRFGNGEGDNSTPSQTLQDLLKRLEKAEKENEENRMTIRELQGIKPVDNIFGEQIADISPKRFEGETKNGIKIPIDKERKVSIVKTGDEARKNIFQDDEAAVTGNIKITSVSKSIPINTPTQNTSFSSSVSKNALETMVEMKQKKNITPIDANPTKQVLNINELIGGDDKIKGAVSGGVIPNVEENKNETKIEVQSDAKSILLSDLEYLKSLDKKQTPLESLTSDISQIAEKAPKVAEFKSEILPATKEERMKQLQDKIKSLNKNISSGGSTNIMNSLASVDPYKL